MKHVANILHDMHKVYGKQCCEMYSSVDLIKF